MEWKTANGEVYQLKPLSSAFRLNPKVNSKDLAIVSPTAFIQFAGGRVVVEDPVSAIRITTSASAPLVDILRYCAEPRSSQNVQDHFDKDNNVLQVFRLLRKVSVLILAEERANSTASHWEFHDLLFHCRTRIGSTDLPYGGTWRLKELIPVPHAIKAPAGQLIELFKPEMAELKASDPPFAKVMEERHSIREHPSTPLTLPQLGEFLFRTLRIREMLPDPTYPMTERPYPSGGRAYELECYLSVGNCNGLPAGLYRYIPDRHALEIIDGAEEGAKTLLLEAGRIGKIQGEPQVLLTLTARFDRVMYKYAAMAYALILKHVGVVQQSFYLTATAMGLGACALGGGNATIFAKYTGIDFFEEGAVGEFLLTSRKA